MKSDCPCPGGVPRARDQAKCSRRASLCRPESVKMTNNVRQVAEGRVSG